MQPTSGPTETEFRALRGAVPDELSALFTHSWDLRQVDEYLGVCLIDDSDYPPFARDMAWDAAIVRYFRAWGMSGSSALQRLLSALPSEHREYHYRLKDVRDKLIAHHRRLGAVCQTVVVSEVDRMGGGRITNVTCLQVRISQLGERHAERFVRLIKALEPIADQMTEDWRRELLAQVSALGRAEIRKLKLVNRESATQRIVRDVDF